MLESHARGIFLRGGGNGVAVFEFGTEVAHKAAVDEHVYLVGVDATVREIFFDGGVGLDGFAELVGRGFIPDENTSAHSILLWMGFRLRACF